MTRSIRLPVVAAIGGAVLVASALVPTVGSGQVASMGDATHACFFSPRPMDVAVERGGRATFECRSVTALGEQSDTVDDASMFRLRRFHRAMFGPWNDANSSRVDWCAADAGDVPRARFVRVTRDMVMGLGDLPVDVFAEGEILRIVRTGSDRWLTSTGRGVPRDAVAEIPPSTTSRFIDVGSCASRVCAWTRYADVALVDARGRVRRRVPDAFSTISVESFDDETVQLSNGLRVLRSSVILALGDRNVARAGEPAHRVELNAQEGVIGLVEDGEIQRVAPFDLRLFDPTIGRVAGATCQAELGVDVKAWWSRECACTDHADRCLSERRTEQYGWVVHAGAAGGANVYFAAPLFGTNARASGRPIVILEPADAESVFEWIGPTLARDALSVRVASESAVEADVLVTYACEHPWW